MPVFAKKSFMAGKNYFWPENFIRLPAIERCGKKYVLGPVWIYIYIYIYRFQNKHFVYIIYVCIVYIYYVYINTHTYLENMYM